MRADPMFFSHHSDRSRDVLNARVVATALPTLCDEALLGYRVAELFAIHRPGDLQKYLSVIVEQADPDTRRKLDISRRQWEKAGELGHELSFDEVDRQMRYYSDIDGWEHDVEWGWRQFRDGPGIRSLLREQLEQARAAQAACRASSDPLVRFELDALDHGRHCSSYRSSPPFVRTRWTYRSPTTAWAREEFLEKLSQLSRRPDVRSASVRGEVGFRVMRLLCSEQQQRAGAAGLERCEAFPICALTPSEYVSDCVEGMGWLDQVHWFSEGLGPMPDLYVEESPGTRVGRSVEWLLRSGRRTGRWILCNHELESPSEQFHRWTIGDGMSIGEPQE